MTSAYNGRLFNAIMNEKKPFDIVWDGQVWDIDPGAAPASENKAVAWDFVKFATDTERLADQPQLHLRPGPEILLPEGRLKCSRTY